MGKIVGLVFPEEKHVCSECGKEFKTEKALKKHLQDEHHAGDPEAPKAEE